MHETAVLKVDKHDADVEGSFGFQSTCRGVDCITHVGRGFNNSLTGRLTDV